MLARSKRKSTQYKDKWAVNVFQTHVFGYPTPVLNISTRIYRGDDLVADAFESEKTKTVKESRDFPDNCHVYFVIQMKRKRFEEAVTVNIENRWPG